MSMLRALPRASTWNNSEYVCLCCRRRLAQSQQRRLYSSAGGSDEYDDDWASNLNSINERSESAAKEPEGVARKYVAATDSFRKFNAADESPRPFIKKLETRRQRIALARGGDGFDALKKSLDSRLDGSSVSPHRHDISESYQPFASETESHTNEARPAPSASDAPVMRSRRARRRALAKASEQDPGAVSTPPPTGCVRDPQFEAIIEELKADFAARLPQLIRDAAKRSIQTTTSTESDVANAGQPMRISDKYSDLNSAVRASHDNWNVNFVASDSKLPENHFEGYRTIHVEIAEKTRFRKMYDDAMLSSYQVSEARTSRNVQNENTKTVDSTFKGDDSETNAVATANGSTASKSNASLDFSEQDKPRSSMTDLLADLPDGMRFRRSTATVNEISEKDNRSADVNAASSDGARLGMFNSTTRLLAAPTEARHVLKIPTEAKRSKSLFPLSSRRLAIASQNRRVRGFHGFGKRSMSITALNRAPSTSNVEPETALGSSTEAIPPWGMAGSDGKTTSHGIQQTSNDADSEFLSLLPTAKQKRSAKQRKDISHIPTENDQGTTDSVADMLQQLLSKEGKKKIKKNEALRAAFEKHLRDVKARSAPEKQVKEVKLPTATKETRERVEASKKKAPRKKAGGTAEEVKKNSKGSKRSGESKRALASKDKLQQISKASQTFDSVQKELESEKTSNAKSEQTADLSVTSTQSRRSRTMNRVFRKHASFQVRKNFRRSKREARAKHDEPLEVPKQSHRLASEKEIFSPRRTRRQMLRNRLVVRYSGPRAPTPRERDSAATRQARDVVRRSKMEEASKAIEVPDTRPLDSLHGEMSKALSAREPSTVASIDAEDLVITPLDLAQPPVPGLQYGLDRTLFNPGVFQLQDPHSRVYNFDPYLQKIMPVVEFDYNALKQYKTSSQDTALSDLAKEHGKRYIGSTSSMTGTLGHFHYLISAFRTLNLKMLSRSFPDSLESFTQINRAPNAIFLRYKEDGIYAIDADKEYDGPNVLMMLGKSMEKLLTLPKAEYERYRKENSHEVTEEERTSPEAYEYTTMGGFLMRSQLDAHDPRLPGTGMFDLKTRAVVSVRMNTSDYEPMTGYEIQTLQGRFQSYEREYYDMMRSTMLKYMLQVRMGRMDGIFLAYHNVERIFGFQYVPLHEMDRALHGQTDPALGDQEFKLSLDLLNKALDKATAKFPNQSLRLHFETSEEQIGTGNPTIMMWIFAEPMGEADIDRIQSASHDRTADFERNMMGIERPDLDLEAADSDVEAAETDANASSGISNSETGAETGADTDAENGTPSEIDEYSTTQSHAAPTFPTELQKPRELKPLFSASIVCKSRVNDTIVQRPQRVKADDKWELEYLLQEWDTNEMMWARYEDMKSRRKGVLEQNLKKRDQEQENGEEDGSEQKKGGGYVEFLKSMSQQGRAFRDKMNELDAGKAPVVVGQPLQSAEEIVESKIDGLDDYLGWLYRGDAQAAKGS